MNLENAFQSLIDQCGVFSPTSLRTQFSLKNFRVFDHKQGATFNLAPITILTGCNSSGKSSVVKAILLLRDFFEQLRTQKIADCKLDFGNKLAKLGKFDNARNCNSRKGSKMTFAYTVRPKEMNKDLRVQLTFAAHKNDVLNSGWLCEILIADANTGEIVLNISNRDTTYCDYVIELINLNPVKNDFLIYALKECALNDAYYSTPTGQDNKYTDEDFVDVNETLELLSDYLNEETYNLFFERVEKKIGGYYESGGPRRSKNNFKREHVINAARNHIIHSLPILDCVIDVPKLDVRRVILDKITSIEQSTSNFDKDLKGFIDKIITAFEQSPHESTLDYLREQETIAFKLSNLTMPYSIGLLSLSEIERCMREFRADYNDRYSMFKLCTFISSNFFKENVDWPYETGPEYSLYTNLVEFYINVIKSALCPTYLYNFEYIGDAAVNIQRLYSSERDDEFGKLLLRYLEACKQNKWQDINAGDFINKWVKKFSLGDHISVSQTAEGLGLVVKLHKSPDDRQGRLLADEGFGITKLIGTMIDIEMSILLAETRDNIDYYILAGAGRSKYPKIARVVTTLAIEEPENHLHPRYQALLAEMFVDAYKNYNIHFIVETHSEYMVRKLQTLVAKKELTQDEVSLQYVYDANPEKRPKGEPHVKSIEIREDGTLRDAFGPGFFDEADNLAMDLLTIKAMG